MGQQAVWPVPVLICESRDRLYLLRYRYTCPLVHRKQGYHPFLPLIRVSPERTPHTLPGRYEKVHLSDRFLAF